MKEKDITKVILGKKVDLSKISPDVKCSFSKDELLSLTEKNIEIMDKLQERLYAENKQSLLVVLQAIDAGGKDGTIRKVFGPLNPQGVQVTSFKAPTPIEKSHDFLWRIHNEVPQNGIIKVFNRSHYEDVLIVRVHDWINE
ncbi:MAG TPA: polyphosphate kinase 2 family protein, partial [Spirochaetota bacterium]|nr:polyphosphate kinase 2 family protein [Spirochaetota bacterium]